MWKEIGLPKTTAHGESRRIQAPLKGWGGVTKTAGSVILTLGNREALMSVCGLVQI